MVIVHQNASSGMKDPVDDEFEDEVDGRDMLTGDL